MEVRVKVTKANAKEIQDKMFSVAFKNEMTTHLSDLFKIPVQMKVITLLSAPTTQLLQVELHALHCLELPCWPFLVLDAGRCPLWLFSWSRPVLTGMGLSEADSHCIGAKDDGKAVN